MSLPEKKLVREKWLHHYESDINQLDAIRTVALNSLDTTTRPATQGWVIKHPLFTAIAACWCVALLFRFTAPEVETPAYAEKFPDQQNRTAPSYAIESFATQHRLLFEYLNLYTELEIEDAKRPAPKNEILSIPPSALLNKNNQPFIQYIA